MATQFTIVKHAQEHVWPHYWSDDPRKGVNLEDSAALTYTGRQVGIKISYASASEAQEDLIEMLEANPSVGYAICPVNSN